MSSAPSRVPIVAYLHLDGDRAHLVANRCADCGAAWFDRRNACGRCGGRSFAESELSTSGRLRTYTIVHRAGPNVPTPYVSAVVELDGGGFVKANLVDVDADPGALDQVQCVELTTFVAGVDDDGTEAVAFAFRPQGEEPSDA